MASSKHELEMPGDTCHVIIVTIRENFFHWNERTLHSGKTRYSPGSMRLQPCACPQNWWSKFTFVVASSAIPHHIIAVVWDEMPSGTVGMIGRDAWDGNLMRRKPQVTNALNEFYRMHIWSTYSPKTPFRRCRCRVKRAVLRNAAPGRM